MNSNINSHYEEFWAKNTLLNVYPTEMVVRIFLAKYPELNMQKPKKNYKVLDIACGDGRSTVFLCQQGYDVYSTEINQGIIETTGKRLKALSLKADLRVGRNSSLPFEDGFFDYILACHCCYNENDIKKYLEPFFQNFSFGHTNNEYFGINERLFWVVCEKSRLV